MCKPGAKPQGLALLQLFSSYEQPGWRFCQSATATSMPMIYSNLHYFANFPFRFSCFIFVSCLLSAFAYTHFPPVVFSGLIACLPFGINYYIARLPIGEIPKIIDNIFHRVFFAWNGGSYFISRACAYKRIKHVNF